MDKGKHTEDLLKAIRKKEKRRLQAKKGTKNWIFWVGMSTFGLIGWTVVIPTVLGVALGIWIDKKWPSPFSWTLMLSVGGILLGCIFAWRWLIKERKEIEREKDRDR